MSLSAVASPNRPQHIPLPPPLRSAMKRSSSRPTTPNQNLLSPPFSPPIGPVPLSPPTLSIALSSTQACNTSVPPSIYSSTHPSSSSSMVAVNAPHLSSSPLVAATGYQPKVSFDTLENPQASMFSYTLHVQSEGYSRTRSTRVFLCASSPDESGTHALEWCLESLVQDGDELVVFRGIDHDDFEKDHDQYRDDARELMRIIQEKCVEYDAERKLSIIVECIAGKVTQTIDRLIALYRPESLVVGTRGQRSMMQAWAGAFGAPGVGSVSKYCLSHSPVPVIVIRPESKVRKTMAKRRADPKRGQHFDTSTSAKANNNGNLSVPMFSALTR